MEAKALEALQAMFSAAQSNVPANTTMVMNNCELQSNEQFADHPTRARGTFKTPSMVDFCHYYALNNLKDVPAQVFIDPVKGYARVAFDRLIPSGPGWSDNKAVLDLEHTDEHLTLCSFINDRRHTQREVVDFISDMRPYITFYNGKEEIINTGLAAQAVSQLKKTDTNQVVSDIGDFEESGSVMNEVKISSSTDNLPSMMSTNMPTFDGFSDHLRMFRISINPESLALSFSEVRKHLVNEVIKQEFIERITETIDKKDIFNGKYECGQPRR